MQRQRYLRSVAVVVIGLAAGVAQAQLTRLWTGAGADNRWSNPSNWNTGVPLPGDLAVLGNSSSDELQVVDLDVNASVSRLSATATGSRDYHITTANGSSITLTGSHDIYCAGRTAALTIDCDVWTTSADLQVDRVGGVTTLNGNCGGAYLYAQDGGELVLAGSNSFTYVYQYGGEIFVKNPHALGNGYLTSKGAPDGILSLATNAVIEGNLSMDYPLRLRLRDSGTNDVTLTIGERCLGGRVTVAPSEGTSTGHLDIRLLINSSHTAEWTLNTNSTLVFANPSGTSTWGTEAAVGSVSGSGGVWIDTGSEVLVNSTNDYTGGTVIRRGSLRLGGSDRLPVAGDLVLAATNATFNLYSCTQTVARLSGVGNVQFAYSTASAVPGELKVATQLAPGGAEAGVLRCNRHGKLVLGDGCVSVFQLGALAKPYDQVLFDHSVSGVTLGGTLQIENLGGLESGDYLLFDLYGGPLLGGFEALVLPDRYHGEIDTSSGDVVLKVTAPPAGSLVIVR